MFSDADDNTNSAWIYHVFSDADAKNAWLDP